MTEKPAVGVGRVPMSREKEWNWWKPSGRANRGMGNYQTRVLVSEGHDVSTPEARLAAMRVRVRAFYR